jgi:hypothetical protein
MEVKMKVLKIAFWILIALLAIITLFFALKGNAHAATNVTSTSPYFYAWDDANHWWDFYNTNTVLVYSTKLEGYASSTLGDLSLDCATSRNGNICGSSNYGICQSLVATHDTSGNCNGVSSAQVGELSGYAWNDSIGWISFCGGLGTSNCPGSITYGVNVDTNTGEFSGYAWNDLVGWISFCGGLGSADCPGSTSYKVITSWTATSSIGYIYSSIFDTQITGGATLNSIVWTGTSNASGTSNQTYVDFQVAVSTSTSGPWTYQGPGGSTTLYYGAPCSTSFSGGTNPTGAPKDTPICIDPSRVSNYRYLRYKVRLRSDFYQLDTPRVDDIILNWSK